ncbi:MAG: hybrid sensor histidine kinase/response regulator [Candidatus Latescibacteria bacterium]|jgi:two-component system, chemotaxis family, sensor kinase CheA|nr:hybrid sensor histidine kinase/response regulator [Candidatus Latescibacterota bacterium]
MVNQEELLNRLLEAFKTEADERLKALTNGLLELEKIPAFEKQVGIIETLFREMHSMKGASRSVNRTDIESVCQSYESVLSKLKRGEISLSPALFDLLYHVLDMIGEIMSAPQDEEDTRASELVEQLSQLTAGGDTSGIKIKSPESTEVQNVPSESLEEEAEKKKDEEKVPAPVHKKEEPDRPGITPTMKKPAVSESIRISTSKLDSLLRQTEEMLSVKLATGQHIINLRYLKSIFSQWEKEWSKIHDKIREDQRSRDRKTHGATPDRLHSPAVKLLEFLEWHQSHVKSLENKFAEIIKVSEHDNRTIGRMVDNLLEDTKKVLMFPFSSLLELFPKMVRDLSRDQSKEVELLIHGGEVEIDKRILEEMKDPLVHLLRNSFDHGIEKPEERKKNKKPRRAKITITISQAESDKVEIRVSDDGGGIDLSKVKETAVKRGLISKQDANKLSEQESLKLIFQSDVSTSAIITELSGRGLGLAIVKEKTEKLGGSISVESELKKGTTFRILLPLTIATFRGVFIRVSDRIFVVPTLNLERTTRIGRHEIKTVENKDTISLNGSTVSFVRLADVLELPVREEDKSEYFPAMILGSGDNRIAFSVDEVLFEQEVLVKNLGKQLRHVRNISGATVLGSGMVVPILNVPDVMKSAVKVAVAPSIKAAPTEEKKAKKRHVLVAEDSITSRILLKNILESAGYYVKTAIDGADAFTTLKTEEFDLVVSDIVMPRMDGFELTSNIRSDKKFAELPVVLVTGLESREDRERGIDVGANAYIVKSSFDQSNLLEVIRRIL